MNSFQRLWSAAGISKFGDGLVLIGLPLYAASISHGSVVAVALVVFAGRLPWLVLSLPAGAYADRRPFRQTMIVSDIARFALVAALAVLIVLHLATLLLLIVVGFALGAFDTAFSAAAANGLPAVVAPDELAKAGGRLFAVEAAGEQVAGPAAAGILYSFGQVVPFVGDALSFLLSAVLLRRLPGAAPATTIAPAVAGSSARPTLRADMRDGLRHFAANRLVRVLTFMVATWSFGQAAVYTLQVLYFTRSLGLSARMFGIVIAGTAITNVIGGLMAERVWKALGTMRLLTVAGLTIPAAFAVAAHTTSPAIAAACFAAESLVTPWVIVATTTLRIQAVPATVRGKMMNLTRTFVVGAGALGTLAAGPLASLLGLRAPMYLGAGLYVVALAAAIRPLRTVLGLAGAEAPYDGVLPAPVLVPA